MKKYVCLVLIFAFMFTLTACASPSDGTPLPEQVQNVPSANTPAPANTDDPPSSDADSAIVPVLDSFPSSGISMSENEGCSYCTETVYFPEDATDGDALFTLQCTLPVFSDELMCNTDANTAVYEYKDELITRIAEEYLPFVDGEAGRLTVTSAVTRCNEYINIFLFEAVSFGDADEDVSLRIIVLDENGERLSLASAAAVYEAEPLAAQQIFNQIQSLDEAKSLYGDITVDDISRSIDIYSMFYAALDGFGIVMSAGSIAPEGEGMLAFIIPISAFYPACVGDTITADEYSRIIEPLNLLAAACALDYSDFDASNPSPYIASSFMNRIITSGAEQTAFVAIARDDYEQIYRSYFASSVPDGMYTDGDGTYADGESIILPVYPHADYIFRIDDAASSGDEITFYGMICFGTPGTADAHELTAASVSVVRSENSACGFIFNSLHLR